MRIESLISAFSTYARGNTQNTSSMPVASEEPTSHPSEDVRVNLSAQAHSLFASQKTKTQGQDQDIENSDLPDTLKQILRQIRELKRQIAEQKAELQRELNRPIANEADADQQEIKLSGLQHQILALTGALVEAVSALGEAMRKNNLTQEQATQVMVLASKEVKPKKSQGLY